MGQNDLFILFHYNFFRLRFPLEARNLAENSGSRLGHTIHGEGGNVQPAKKTHGTFLPSKSQYTKEI